MSDAVLMKVGRTTLSGNDRARVSREQNGNGGAAGDENGSDEEERIRGAKRGRALRAPG